MTGFLYVLTAITVFLAGLTVFVQCKGLFGIKFLVKSLTSFGFLTIGLVAFFYLDHVEKWHIIMAIGLALGLMGDVFLASKGVVEDRYVEPLLLAGLVFFLLGHVAYISVFVILSEAFSYFTLIPVVACPILMFILMQLGVIIVKKEKIPILVYSAVLGLMLGQAVNYAVENTFSTRSTFFFVAAILFLFSDFMLTLFNFGKPKLKGSSLVTSFYMPSYYIAQCLFALAIIF